MFRKKSLFQTLLFSYLLMLLVAIAIGFGSHQIYSSAMKEQMKSYNSAMLEQARSILDERMKSINQAMMNIQIDATVRSLLNSGSSPGGMEKYNLYLVTQLLSNTVLSNTTFESVYIYLKNSNLIVSNSTVCTPEDFYYQNYHYTDWDYKAWRALMEEQHFMRFIPEQTVTSYISGKGEKKKVISLLLSLPLGLSDGSQGVLVASIDSQRLKSLLSEANILNASTLFIMDTQSKVLLSIGDDAILRTAASYPFKEADSLDVSLDGSNVILSNVRSSVNSWRYVSVIPQESFMQPINQIQFLLLCFALPLLLIGVIMAFWLASKTFRPIKTTAAILREQYQGDGGVPATRNELDYIHFMAKTTFGSISALRTELTEQLPVIKANLLLRLLKGDFSEEENLSEQLRKAGLLFPHPYFAVMPVHVDEFSEDSYEERSLMKFVIGNIVKYSLEGEGEAFQVDLDRERLALILNLKGPPQRVDEIIEKTGRQAIDVTSVHFRTVITMAVGSLAEDVKEVHRSYRQGLQALEYQQFKAKGQILFFEGAVFPAHTYSYTLETEMQLIQSIRSGNYERVERIFDQVCSENFSNDHFPQKMIPCLYFDVMSTGFKVLSELGIDMELVFGSGENPYERLLSCKNAEEMQAALKPIYKKICDYISDHLKRRNSQLIDQLCDYIKANSSLPQIGLATVAAAFGMNPNYLSGYFKERTGENFMDYLNLLRINQVKVLLRESDTSLQIIAEKTGYSNSSVLIRNFKKYAGMTPGEFRQSLHMTDNQG